MRNHDAPITSTQHAGMTDEKLIELAREIAAETRDEDYAMKCPTCEGKGRLWLDGERCPDCEGDGWIEI